MNKISGLHHLAISTGDMKKQIAFFTDVLGMELVALYWMHGVEGFFHGFLKMGDGSCVAFVFSPENTKLETTLGLTHPGNPGGTSAPGTLQHVSLNVADMDEMLVMRDRLRSKDVPVLGPVDHGFCYSIYFAGPENLSLEISCNNTPLEPNAWIDPEVVEKCGISAEELERFKAPKAYTNDGEPIAQPSIDGAGPHMTGYPEGAYELVLTLSDEEVAGLMNENEPPVKV